MSFSAISEHYRGKSAVLLLTLENRFDRILVWWLVVAGLAAALRLVVGPVPYGQLEFGSVAPYLLLVLAPVASALLALRLIEAQSPMPQPTTRLAIFGKWRNVSRAEAEAHPLFGTGGIMVSLLIGMLLNVPVRTAEYLVAIPPIAGGAPPWLATLHFAMTFDVVLFSSLYAIAFVAALRKVPLFPRLLVAIWVCDLAAQLLVAQTVAATALPPTVAAALHPLLDGNIKKVLISAALWLPYLLLSTRVNVTYRSRLPA